MSASDRAWLTAGAVVVVILQLTLAGLYRTAPEANAAAQLRRNFESLEIERRQLAAPFVPNWRPDGRCGADFPGPDGSAAAVCNPFEPGRSCCSHWGWCGGGARFCEQGSGVDPHNSTSTGRPCAPGALVICPRM